MNHIAYHTRLAAARIALSGIAIVLLMIGMTGSAIPTVNAAAGEDADATADHPITGTSITIAADTSAQIRGHTFAAYQLADYTTQTAGAVGLTTIAEPTSAYRHIQNAMAQANPAYNAERDGDPFAWAVQVEGRLDHSTASPWTGLTRALATALDPAELGTPVTVTANDDSIVTTGEQVTVTLNGLKPGLYMIVDVTGQRSQREAGTPGNDEATSWTNSTRMVVGTRLAVWDAVANSSTILADGVVNLKNQSVPIYKQIVDPDGRPQSEPDYTIGDTIHYEITSTVPVYTGYSPTGRVYRILDTMSQGLTYVDVASVSIGETTLVESTDGGAGDYTVSVRATTYESRQGSTGQVPDALTGKPATEITVDLSNYVNQTNNANPLQEGATVTVLIDATLNDNAVVSDPGQPQGNPNKVDLVYSHNPEDLTDQTTVPGGEVNAYTFRFRIRKTDLGTGRPLEGAEFIVKSADRGYLKTYETANADRAGGGQSGDDKPGDGMSGDDVSGDGQSGGWRYTPNESDAMVFTSDADGMIDGLDGLDAGTYTVTETKAPNDYQNAMLPTFSFTITAAYQQDSSTKPDDADAWGDHHLGTVTFGAPEGDVWKLVTQGGVGAGGTDGSGGVDGSEEAGDANGSGDANDGVPTFQYTVGNVRNVSALPKTGAAGVVMLVPIVALLVAAAIISYLHGRALQRNGMHLQE
ncbi:isopeptide-forming domain-containing fimbrial protein [Bifidobacterium callimiconis]|uniref:isopeptide-forming domain-containing fimbrial protein n=1 Tax=Bifidobacterium callimiconis TaxID=2306973 RepID=UPI001BDC9091|nr:isopeptide-forming domain-containing fimbrial protein [Bifidobacterium callimiconis]MBT1176961.1 isopeptide-forming domain-containing fimbrial protein [Bifidobacterium callimiconis]